MEPTQTQIAYFAGFVDGEGSISISRRKFPGSTKVGHSLQVSVTQVVRAPLDEMLRLFGGSIRVSTVRGKALYHCLTLSGPKAGKFLKLARPYLILKKAEADTAL